MKKKRHEENTRFCGGFANSRNLEQTISAPLHGGGVGVRLPSAPPVKTRVLQDKLWIKDERSVAGVALVQRPCSNAEGESAKA